MQAEQAREVEVGPVHDVEGAGFGDERVEHADVVGPRLGDMHERGDAAAQVEERVQLDAGLGGAEQGPREQGEAQVDGGGVERVDGVVEVEPEVVVRVQGPGDVDQRLGEVRVDAPVAPHVGVGQGVARHAAADAHVVELVAVGAQADLDVAQALAQRQLGEGHAQELVEAGEGLDPAVAVVAPHAAAKGLGREMVHELGKDESARMHDGILCWTRSGR